LRETIRALLIDDDQGDFVFTKGLLSQITHPTIELDWVPTFEEGHDAIANGGYDVYLVDYFLEDRTGLDLLREAARHQLQAPVIMLTGRGSHEVDIEAMQAGAADYLVKGQIEPEDLERSIRYALDRMEAQRALKASEERHRAMFDHLPLGVYRCTPEGEFLDANPALVRILGYPDPASLDSQYASTFYVSDEDAEIFKARLEEFGIVRGFETQLRGVDGRTIRLRNTARIHRDADGNVGYVEGIIEDVSREGSLLASNREATRYKALYECDHIGILTLDRSGEIQDGNAALRALSGYDEEDLSSVEYPELFEEGDRAGVLEEIRQLSAGGSAIRKESRDLRMKDGSTRTVSTLSILIRDWDGDPNHILIVIEAAPTA
jgi:PAS domain S-box-containing protein